MLSYEVILKEGINQLLCAKIFYGSKDKDFTISMQKLQYGVSDFDTKALVLPKVKRVKLIFVVNTFLFRYVIN